MKKTYFLIALLTFALFMTACSQKESASGTDVTPAPTDQKYADGKTSQESNTDVPMRDFFLPPGANAHYEGEGHDRAELKVEVAQPYEKHFVVYEKKGDDDANYVRRTYRLGTDKIEILEEKPVNYEQDFPLLEEVQTMEPIGIYLQKPFKKGTTFDNWTIVETDVSVETPYRTFDNAFVIEQKKEGAVIRKYFVQGFGEVKRESIMRTTDGDEETHISTLRSIDGVSR